MVRWVKGPAAQGPECNAWNLMVEGERHLPTVARAFCLLTDAHRFTYTKSIKCKTSEKEIGHLEAEGLVYKTCLRLNYPHLQSRRCHEKGPFPQTKQTCPLY